MGVIGDTLRETREQRGISISKAESDTKIKARYLVALEEEEFSHIPGGDYVVKGFIGSYAGYLGLDSAELISLYNREVRGQARSVSTISPPKPIKETSRFGAVIVLAAVVIIVLGSAAYWFRDPINSLVHREKPTPTPINTTLLEQGTPAAGLTQLLSAGTSMPTATPTPKPFATREPQPIAPPVSPGIHLTTRAIQDCWMHVEADGEPVWDGILETGQSRNWEAKDKLVIQFGNPTGIETTFNGKFEGNVGNNLEKTWVAPPPIQ